MIGWGLEEEDIGSDYVIYVSDDRFLIWNRTSAPKYADLFARLSSLSYLIFTAQIAMSDMIGRSRKTKSISTNDSYRLYGALRWKSCNELVRCYICARYKWSFYHFNGTKNVYNVFCLTRLAPLRIDKIFGIGLALVTYIQWFDAQLQNFWKSLNDKRKRVSFGKVTHSPLAPLNWQRIYINDTRNGKFEFSVRNSFNFDRSSHVTGTRYEITVQSQNAKNFGLDKKYFKPNR